MSPRWNADMALRERLRLTADLCDDLREGRDPSQRIYLEWQRLASEAPSYSRQQAMALLRTVHGLFAAQPALPAPVPERTLQYAHA